MLCSPERVGVVERSAFSAGAFTSYVLIWCGTISSRSPGACNRHAIVLTDRCSQQMYIQ